MRTQKLSPVWVTVVALLTHAGFAYAQSPNPTPTSAISSSNSAWLDNLTTQLRAAKEIQFDAVLNGTANNKKLPPIEISGYLGAPGEMNVSILKAGGLVCTIISGKKGSVAYSPVSHRYLTFDMDDLSYQKSFSDPEIFTKTDVGQYILDQVGQFSEASLVIIVLLQQAPISLFDSLIGPDGNASTLSWTLTETSDNGMTIEHQTASKIGSMTWTYSLDYSKVTGSLISFYTDRRNPGVAPSDTADVTFKQCDLLPASGIVNDPDQFSPLVPSDAIAWIPPHPK